MENVKRDKKMKQHKTQETTLLATQPTSNSKNSNRNNKMTFFSQQRHTSTKPKPLSLSLLYLFLLTCCTSLGSVQASSLGFQYDNVAGCSSSVAEINSLSVSCDGNGDSSVCRTGDRVRVMGTFTSTIDIPEEVNVQVKICKFWGTMCTSSLVDEDVNFCDLIGTEGDDNYYCAPAGTYSFEEEFEIPEASLSNFAVNGVTFRTYVELNGEFTCHAQWKTVKISNAYSMLGIVFVVVSAVSLVFVQQRRRLRTKRAQKMNLQEEEQRADAANTVEIDFSGNSNRNHKHHRENHVTMEMDHYVSL